MFLVFVPHCMMTVHIGFLKVLGILQPTGMKGGQSKTNVSSFMLTSVGELVLVIAHKSDMLSMARCLFCKLSFVKKRWGNCPEV